MASPASKSSVQSVLDLDVIFQTAHLGLTLFLGSGYSTQFFVFSYKCAIECLKVTVEPQIHSHPNLRRDHGTLAVHEYIDPVTLDRQIPTNYWEDMDLTMTWTTRYELDFPMPRRRMEKVQEN